MEIPLGPYTIGIDNVSADGDLPRGAVADAENVDFGRGGDVARRSGYTRRLETTSAHSLWTAPDGRSFGVIDGSLVRLTWDGSALASTVLADLQDGRPLSYDQINDSIVCGNLGELLEIAADDTVRNLALQRGGLFAEESDVGGLTAGRYAVAASMLRGNEEGAMSSATFVDVPEGGGINVWTPPSADATAVRIYRTEPNGEILYRAADVPLESEGLTIGAGQLGRATDTQHMAPMQGGSIVRYWRGHILAVRGRTLIWSEPMRYGLRDTRHNFIQSAKQITLMEPVEGGVFVGTNDGVVFFAGTSPRELTLKRTSGEPPVAHTGMKIQASLLAGDQVGDTYVAAWFAKNGIVIGTSDGQLREVHAKRFRLPGNQAAGVGAAVIHDRRALVTIN